MKILITKDLGNHYEGLRLGEEKKEKVLIDPFAGCLLGFPEGYTAEDEKALIKGLIGTILDLKDDVYVGEGGVYLPSEKDFK